MGLVKGWRISPPEDPAPDDPVAGMPDGTVRIGQPPYLRLTSGVQSADRAGTTSPANRAPACVGRSARTSDPELGQLFVPPSAPMKGAAEKRQDLATGTACLLLSELQGSISGSNRHVPNRNLWYLIRMSDFPLVVCRGSSQYDDCWRMRALDALARIPGIHFHVDGFPFGRRIKNWTANPDPQSLIQFIASLGVLRFEIIVREFS
jgi:hypothetical protein